MAGNKNKFPGKSSGGSQFSHSGISEKRGVFGSSQRRIKEPTVPKPTTASKNPNNEVK